MSSNKIQIEFYGNTKEYDLTELSEKYELGLRKAILTQQVYDKELTLTFRLGNKIPKSRPNVPLSIKLEQHININELEGLHGIDFDIKEIELYMKRSYRNSPNVRISKVPNRVMGKILSRLKELKKIKTM